MEFICGVDYQDITNILNTMKPLGATLGLDKSSGLKLFGLATSQLRARAYQIHFVQGSWYDSEAGLT